SPRTKENSSMSSAASRAAAAISTVTEVSIRHPSQVIATSPGRSASHTMPSAASETSARNRTTRIIARLASLGRPGERFECVRRQLLGRIDRSDARLGGLDPGGGRRTPRLGQPLDTGERARDVAAGRLELGACDHGRGLVAGRLLDGTDADQPLRARLEALDHARLAPWRAG